MLLKNHILENLPPHVKNDKDFTNIIEVFLEVVQENYNFSQDILQTKMVDLLAEKFQETKETRYSKRREEILKLHLNELFNAVERSSTDDDFYNRLTLDFKKLGIETKDFQIYEKFINSLNQNTINANKSFNVSKGKLVSFMYIFNIISLANLQGVNSSDGFLRVINGIDSVTKKPVPFNYVIESSLYEETFNALIKPLVHPIGFGYAFITLLYFEFEDYFSVQIKKYLDECFIRCLQPDGSYVETNMLEHKLLEFDELESPKGKIFWMKYVDKDTNEIKKLVSNPGEQLKIYSLHDIQIKDVSLKDITQGIITENRDEHGNLLSLKYNQFFISRKEQVIFRFTLKDDLEEAIYHATLDVPINDIPLVNGETYVEALEFSLEDILENVNGTFNGKLIEKLPRTCGLDYTIRVEQESTLKDYLIWEYEQNFRDYWCYYPIKDYIPEELPETPDDDTQYEIIGDFLIIGEFNIGKSPDNTEDEVQISDGLLIGSFNIGEGNTQNPNAPNGIEIGKEYNIGYFVVGKEKANISNKPQKPPLTAVPLNNTIGDTLAIGEFLIQNELQAQDNNFIQDVGNGTAVYYIGFAIDETKDQKQFVSEIGKFRISNKEAEIPKEPDPDDPFADLLPNKPQIPQYPPEYPPEYIFGNLDAFDEDIPYIWQKELPQSGLIYPTKYWYMEYPKYSVVTDICEVKADGYEKRLYNVPAFEAMLDELHFKLDKNDSRKMEKREWYISEELIGEKRDQQEIDEIINKQTLPIGDSILTIPYKYTNKNTADKDGDYYPYEIDDDDLLIKLTSYLNLDDYVDVSDDFSLVETLLINDYYYGDVICNDLWIGKNLEYGDIIGDEALELGQFVIGNRFVIDKDDWVIGLECYAVCDSHSLDNSWTLGFKDRYEELRFDLPFNLNKGDDETLKLHNHINRFNIGNKHAFIGYEDMFSHLDGELYPLYKADDEFDFISGYEVSITDKTKDLDESFEITNPSTIYDVFGEISIGSLNIDNTWGLSQGYSTSIGDTNSILGNTDTEAKIDNFVIGESVDISGANPSWIIGEKETQEKETFTFSNFDFKLGFDITHLKIPSTINELDTINDSGLFFIGYHLDKDKIIQGDDLYPTNIIDEMLDIQVIKN